MARKPTPQPLTIPAPGAAAAAPADDSTETKLSPLSAPAPLFRSPRTPRSPFRFSAKLGQSFGDHLSMQAAERDQQARRKEHPSLPQTDLSLPLATQDEPGRDRPSTSPARGGFFSSYKSSKASNRSQPSVSTIHPVVEERASRDSDRPAASANVSAPEGAGSGTENSNDMAIPRRPVGGHSKSYTSTTTFDPISGPQASSAGSNNASVRKHKPKPFGLLSRTRSIRNDKDGQSPNDLLPMTVTEPERAQTSYGIKTAPLRADYDKSFREIMNSAPRNRSADRQHGGGRSTEREAKDPKDTKDTRDNGRHHHQPMPSRDTGGSSYFNLMKSGSSKAVSMGRGIFSKVGRSYSNTEKEPPVDDEHYVLKVINLPLIEQTRVTRISKKLETSRDKTEFWMPAFPWRAIDYLNYRGTETEGLYRVPGSGPQIKKWQRKFDEELDVDLFEQEDLYDINIIGSMLKAWLRELPDELFPKAAQDRIARECSGSEEMPPQPLIDEISNLPPYNYYLLFAITCHLSLLLTHSDKNKMDFRNLCICFQPCMKIDAFCFKFLVIDWAECWKGCKMEQFWIDQEYQLFDTVPPSSGAESVSSAAVESHDERNVSSSDSSKPSSVAHEHSKSRSMPKHPPISQSISSISSQDTSSTITTLTLTEQTTPRYTGKLEPLAPIQPLSPMNF